MAKQYFSVEDFPEGSQEREILFSTINNSCFNPNKPWHDQAIIQLRSVAGSTVKDSPINSALNRVANYIETIVTGHDVNTMVCSREPTKQEAKRWKKL